MSIRTCIAIAVAVMAWLAARPVAAQICRCSIGASTDLSDRPDFERSEPAHHARCDAR